MMQVRPGQLAELKAAIDTEDLGQVQALLQHEPELHRAPLGYAKDGPLTWVAECRVPRRAPSPARLAIAEWMIESGSDVHQGGDAPLARAALDGERIPMMELLVQHGANVNALWHGDSPVVPSPCETVDPEALGWLLEHGADPNGGASALDYLVGSYLRAPGNLAKCIDLLLAHGAKTEYKHPAMLAILRNQPGLLEDELSRDPELVRRRFHDLTFGTTGGRMLTLKGGTLLHVAAEFGNLAAAQLLRRWGADVNAPAGCEDNSGGQTAIFHSATQSADGGLPMTKWLVEEGADLSVRCKLPGYYESPGEIVECTPLGYAVRFPGEVNETVRFLRGCGAPE